MVCSLLLAPVANLEAQSYSYQTLNITGSTTSLAYGINDAGQIVGVSQYGGSAYLGFLYSGGLSTAINYPGAAGTIPFAINNSGTIVGYYQPPGDVGFLRSTGGTYTSITAADNVVTGINDQGDFVGTNLSTDSGFVSKNGSLQSFQIKEFSTTAWGINNSGQISGTAGNGPDDFAFLLTNGSVETIMVPGSQASIGYAVNNSGEVAGWYYTPAALDTQRGFVFTRSEYQLIDYPGATGTEVFGIND